MLFYIHIPFCKSKCKYCNFVSFANSSDLLKKQYVNSLIDEIVTFFDNYELNKKGKIETIYFGGWTPTSLDISQIENILKAFPREYFSWNIEINIETNPENIETQFIDNLSKIWINRLSLGIQSLNPQTLKEIGRSWPKSIYEALDILKKSSIINIGVDFILGLPYAKKWQTSLDISRILEKFPFIKHLSLYLLEDFSYPEYWKNISISKDEYLEEYDKIISILKENGFCQYEISNFAKSSFKCKHNSWYWQHKEYKWFGINASSFIDNSRFTNANNFEDYYSRKLQFEEKLTKHDLELEKAMFTIRTTWIRGDMINNKEKLSEFLKEDFLFQDKQVYKLTTAWIMIVDYILINLI